MNSSRGRIITDCQEIAALAVAREVENMTFRTYLKQLPLTSETLDGLVQELTGRVTAQIDCTQCANCCRCIHPLLDAADVVECTAGLQMPVEKFEEVYLEPWGDEVGKYAFRELPCPFLKQQHCINYEHRPANCRAYPYLDKRGFVFRLWGVIDNYGICPIVFNVYEQLKAELREGFVAWVEYGDGNWMWGD
jgi:hypothetical protein